METDRAILRLVQSGTLANHGWRDPDSPRFTPRIVPRNPTEQLNAVRLLALDAHGRALDWITQNAPALLPQVQETVLSQAKVKATLPPAVYDQACCAAGSLTVRVK